MRLIPRGSSRRTGWADRRGSQVSGGDADPPGGFRLQVPLRISDATIKAIEDFQKLYGPKSDGLVDPGKTALRRLNELATPIRLNAISLGRISKGGYIISYQGKHPLQR